MSDVARLSAAWDEDADVIVVGFGAAGASAAIEAYDAGSSVLILEKEPYAGGTTIMSGGIIVGAGTSVQRERNVSDSSEEMYRYFSATGCGLENPDLMRTLCDNSGPNIEWLRTLGMEFQSLFISGSEAYPEYSGLTPAKPRGHGAGGGRRFFKVLKTACGGRGIKALYNARLKRLISDPAGEVQGVEVGNNEATQNFKARKAVVLTCGGYGNNREMLKQYSFDKGYRALYAGNPSHTGDGIRAGQMLGADLACMGQIGAVPSVRSRGQNIARLAPGNPIGPGIGFTAIAVNQKGRRFTNESGFYNYVAYDMLIPGNLPNYLVFDYKVRTAGPETWPPWSGNADHDIEEGTTKKAETIRELAIKMGVDPSTLESTVKDYNANAAKGVDPDFGKTTYLAPIQTPPYYAFERIVGMHSTLGGLKINTLAQVIGVNGSVIRRLYAAGETTGGAIGLNYPASGTAIQNAVCFGRIAGKNAANEATW